MTSAQLVEWSALLTGPFIATAILYLGIPTVTKQFPTTHQLVGWIATPIGVVYLFAPFTFNLGFALCNTVLTAFVFWLVWRSSVRAIRQNNGTIPVLFFGDAPDYGRNLFQIKPKSVD